jgi:mono/diheme cytochrome c family protein
MNDPKDPFRLTRGKLFLYGSAVTLVLAALTWLYVPTAPRDIARSAPLEGPGSQSAALEGVPSDASAPSSTTGEGGAGSAGSPQGAAALRAAQSSPEALYERFCVQCHGADGRGKTMMSRMMEGGVPNIVEGPFAVERNIDAIARLVRQGSANKRMPGFEREIGEDASRELASYVLAFPDTKKADETK